jgi:hypothetical protein
MKQKTINPGKGVELVAQDKIHDTKVSHSIEEVDLPDACWPAYSSPLMPVMDLTIVFDELKKMVKNWFLNKRERTNHL